MSLWRTETNQLLLGPVIAASNSYNLSSPAAHGRQELCPIDITATHDVRHSSKVNGI
jgi:hypothetical protein